jgi:hypothetical protein
VICIGESHIIVGLIFENLEDNNEQRRENNTDNRRVVIPLLDKIAYNSQAVSTQIMLRFIRGPRISETIKFMPDDAPILIGRNSDCHIQVA